MNGYLGDFATGATVYVPFHTFAAAGNSVTLTGLAVTDIEVYKDGSTTQRSSDNGYTLLDTDGIDFDGVTGIHGFKIDLSDNTDAGFYAAGHDYFVVVASVTVDSQTVNFVACSFSIENRNSKVATGGISAASFGAGAIDATAIAADAIGASEIAANAITSSEVADDSIDAGAIAADAIGASEIATSAIGAAEIAADAIGASEIATDAIGAAELAADAVDEILDEVVEGALTLRNAIRLVLSFAAGKASGGGTSTVTFRDTTDAKNRIVMTTDSDGNRTAVTLDAS